MKKKMDQKNGIERLICTKLDRTAMFRVCIETLSVPELDQMHPSWVLKVLLTDEEPLPKTGNWPPTNLVWRKILTKIETVFVHKYELLQKHAKTYDMKQPFIVPSFLLEDLCLKLPH